MKYLDFKFLEPVDHQNIAFLAATIDGIGGVSIWKDPLSQRDRVTIGVEGGDLVVARVTHMLRSHSIFPAQELLDLPSA